MSLPGLLPVQAGTGFTLRLFIQNELGSDEANEAAPLVA